MTVAHTSRSLVTKLDGPHRTAQLDGFEQLIHFGIHGGIKSFYHPRSHPDGVNVNVRCLDEGTVQSMNVIPFDGRHWEEQYPEGRAEGYANYTGD